MYKLQLSTFQWPWRNGEAEALMLCARGFLELGPAPWKAVWLCGYRV